MARLKAFEDHADVSLLMPIMGGFAVAMLRNYGFSTSKIRRIMVIDWYALRRLMELNEVLEFSG